MYFTYLESNWDWRSSISYPSHSIDWSKNILQWVKGNSCRIPVMASMFFFFRWSEWLRKSDTLWFWRHLSLLTPYKAFHYLVTYLSCKSWWEITNTGRRWPYWTTVKSSLNFPGPDFSIFRSSEAIGCFQNRFCVGYRIQLKCVSLNSHVSFRHCCRHTVFWSFSLCILSYY